MNRASIEWCHYTWNPVTGCRGGCSYCYARRIATRFAGTKAFPNGFEPTFHPERLGEPAKVKKPSRIFVGSMTDFGRHPEHLQEVLTEIHYTSRHRYIFLTKDPEGLRGFDFPDCCWVGVSAEEWLMAWPRLAIACDSVSANLFLCLEPLLGPVVHMALDASPEIRWIILGAQTNPYKGIPATSIKTVISAARIGKTPLFIKDNVNWPEKIQEFPEDLKLGNGK